MRPAISLAFAFNEVAILKYTGDTARIGQVTSVFIFLSPRIFCLAEINFQIHLLWSRIYITFPNALSDRINSNVLGRPWKGFCQISKGECMIHRLFGIGIATCLYLIGGASDAYTLTLDAILAELRAQPVMDTFDVKMTTTVTVGGQAVSLNSHVISKGPDKMWMEQQTPAGTQRIIRNGQMAQSIDLRTGQKQTMNTRDLEALSGATKRQASFFESGRFAAPRSIGENRYQVDMIPGSDSTSVSSSMVYDAARKVIVKVSQVGVRGDTTFTEMVHGKIQGRNVLTSMKIEVRLEGMATRMEMNYFDYAFPETILDALFSIKE